VGRERKDSHPGERGERSQNSICCSREKGGKSRVKTTSGIEKLKPDSGLKGTLARKRKELPLLVPGRK